MKKLTYIAVIAIAIVSFATVAGNALALVITDSNSYTTVSMERISPNNRNLTVNGTSVNIGWMTNQFTDGYVMLEDDMEYIYKFDAEEEIATYHTVKFTMPRGTYTITRVSYGGMVRDFGQELIIK